MLEVAEVETVGTIGVTVTFTEEVANRPVELFNALYVRVYVPQATWADTVEPFTELFVLGPVIPHDPLPQLGVLYVPLYVSAFALDQVYVRYVPGRTVTLLVPLTLRDAVGAGTATGLMIKFIGVEVITPLVLVPCTCTCTDPPVKPVGGIVIVIDPEPEFPALT
jgi:hypothetical protein